MNISVVSRSEMVGLKHMLGITAALETQFFFHFRHRNEGRSKWNKSAGFWEDREGRDVILC